MTTLPEAALAVALVPLIVTLLAVNLRRPALAGLSLCALLLTAACLPLALPSLTRNTLDGEFPWRSWIGNDPFSRGLFAALARDAADARLAERALADLEPLPLPEPRETGTRRNLHVLLVESPTDPVDIDAGFPRASLDPRLDAWSRGRALAPRYGSGSAQSEFELLCGLPATASLPDPVVFNGLRGSPAPCLPRWLAARGYRTFASVPVEPWFYNARRAYASLGFHDARFGPELPPRTRRRGVRATRELLRHNRHWLSARLPSEQPLINYVATVEPHFPFVLPPGCEPLEAGTPLRTGLATGLRDATGAIADHVEWLLLRDPEALILVVGDHQAPGFAEAAANPEQLLGQLGVPLALLDAGRPLPLGLVPHFRLPGLLLSRLEPAPASDVDLSWLRPLSGGRVLFSRGGGVGSCPSPGADCAEVLAVTAALEERTRRLVAMAR